MRQTSIAFYQLVRASFLERTRRNSFLLITGLTIYLAYLFVPPLDANYLTVTLANQRGIYNSPWIGTMFGLAASLPLSLLAFYLVKGAVNLDRNTRVGRVIAATPVSRPLYTLGKWLSNLVVLVIILTILTVMALVMQLIRAEDRTIDLVALAAPIWLMGLPMVATVAAVAVLFECISFLRGGFGNVVYFFVWIFVLTALISNLDKGPATANDFFGISYPLASMRATMLVEDPAYDGDFGIGRSGFTQPVQTFVWHGVDWNIPIVLERLRWFLLAIGLAWVAALPFDRFDPTRDRPPGPIQGDKRQASDVAISQTHQNEIPTQASVSLLKEVFRPSSGAQRLGEGWTGGILLAELRLALRGQPWWWYAVAGILIVASLASAPASSLKNVLPFAWIWPILIWSQLGAREEEHFTDKIIFSVPHPIRRQLPATWIAGVIVALITGSGVAVRLLAAAQWDHLLAWGIAALFIPSLALALGTMSGTSRLFEIVYLVWWYVAVNGGPSLDFMASSQATLAMGTPLKYLGLTLTLLGAAVFGRRRQLQN